MDTHVISKTQLSSQVEKTCPHCGLIFKCYPSRGKKFCSKQCRIAFKETNQIYQKCANCGDKFKISPSQAGKVKFCSKQCRLDYKSKKAIYDKCAYCGKPFRVYLSSEGKIKYCSRECRITHVKETYREERACKECGNVFLAYKSQDTLFCSHECYSINKTFVEEKVCTFCGVKFKPKGGGVGKYCSVDCYYNDNDKKPSVDMPCSNCGKLIPIMPYRMDRSKNVFCSTKCKSQFQFKDRLTTICKNCGKPFDYKQSSDRVFCSNDCMYEHRFEKKYNSVVEQIGFAVETRRDPQDALLIEVRCAYCGKWHNPKGQTLNATVCAAKFKHYDAKFYCSEGCKNACPVFKQIKYPKGFKKATSREAIPLVRQMTFERDGYECQHCGVSIEDAQLHCHHIEGVKHSPMVQNDVENCITLCKKCHVKLHKTSGCTNQDYMCA